MEALVAKVHRWFEKVTDPAKFRTRKLDFEELEEQQATVYGAFCVSRAASKVWRRRAAPNTLNTPAGNIPVGNTPAGNTPAAPGDAAPSTSSARVTTASTATPVATPPTPNPGAAMAAGMTSTAAFEDGISEEPKVTVRCCPCHCRADRDVLRVVCLMWKCMVLTGQAFSSSRAFID